MLTSERQAQILAELQKDPKLTVAQMAKRLHFSEPTIRRDYTQLHRKGIITKHYGYVTVNCGSGSPDQEIPFILRENERSKPKEQIALAASQLVRDGMVIMLDGSTSAYHMVPYLSKFKDIIVITSGAKTAVALAELQIPVFSTGGKMRTNSYSYIGKEAEDAVRKYNADIAFFSCHGLSLDGMMSDPSVEECHLRQVMLEKAQQCYLLCDSSKLGKTYFYDMGNVSRLDGVISDKPLPETIAGLLPNR